MPTAEPCRGVRRWYAGASEYAGWGTRQSHPDGSTMRGEPTAVGQNSTSGSASRDNFRPSSASRARTRMTRGTNLAHQAGVLTWASNATDLSQIHRGVWAVGAFQIGKGTLFGLNRGLRGTLRARSLRAHPAESPPRSWWFRLAEE